MTMKTTRAIFGAGRAGALLALLSSALPLHAVCDQPGEMLQHLGVALGAAGMTAPACTWTPALDPTYNSWAVGGSQNLPAIAAATALVTNRNFNGTDWAAWWSTYLDAQLGLRNADATLPPNLKFFAGTEALSRTYWWTNLNAMLAVHYWARVRNAGSSDAQIIALGNSAERLLRTNAYIASLTASESLSGVRSVNSVYQNSLPKSTLGTGNYTGPFLALASGRAKWGFSVEINHAAMLGRALGLPAGSPAGREDTRQVQLVTWLVARWTPTTSSLFGLTSGDVAALRTLIDNAVLPANLSAVLSGIATANVTHFLGWPGVRCSLIEGNTNYNTYPLPAECWYRSGPLSGAREVNFLEPFQDRNKVPQMSAFVDLVGHYMEATQQGVPGDSTYPATTVRMPIPSATPAFHVVLPLSAPAPSCPVECRDAQGNCSASCDMPCRRGCWSGCLDLCVSPTP